MFADECYADIYLRQPPVGALPVRGAPFERLLSFPFPVETLRTARICAPGMVAGDAKLMAKFRALRNYAGPQVPLPIIAASAAAWSDETHVAANRAALCGDASRLPSACSATAPGFRLPEGGFFLWLEVGDGEDTALRLWRKGGVRVLPGAYMGREIEPGKPRTNPGFSYIRVALVNDLSTIMAALERMVEILDARRHERGHAPRYGGGVYQPRSRSAAMADALADARRALARLTRLLVMRGAGAGALPRHHRRAARARQLRLAATPA